MADGNERERSSRKESNLQIKESIEGDRGREKKKLRDKGTAFATARFTGMTATHCASANIRDYMIGIWVRAFPQSRKKKKGTPGPV